MPRVHKVISARKPQGHCGKCGCEIKPGDGYLFWEFRFGGKRKRCMNPACAPKSSDLTSSTYLSQAYAIEENFNPPVGDFGEAAEYFREVAGRVEDLKSEVEDSMSNMESAGTGLENSPTYELLSGRADALGELISQLEEASSELDSIALDDEIETAKADGDIEVADDDTEEDIEEKVGVWAETFIEDKILEVAGGIDWTFEW